MTGRVRLKTLREYQQQGVEIISRRNILLGDDCGLGKTVQAVRGVHGISGPKLVVCLKPAKAQWRDEIFEEAPGSDVYVCQEGGRFFETPPWKDLAYCDWVVIHYEALRLIHPVLKDVQWGAIIVDEAHKLKNPKTVTKRCLRQLKATRRIALTGTPMDKKPTELWSILNFLEPRKYSSYWLWSNSYERYDRSRGYPKYLGPKCLDNMFKVIGGDFVRRRKHEVASDLPQKNVFRIPVDMTDEQMILFSEVMSSMDIEADVGGIIRVIPNVLSKMSLAQQVVSCPRGIGYDIDSCKVE